MVAACRTVNTVPKASADKPLWGRRIAARRKFLGKSLVDIENSTNGKLYQALLYRIENGKKHPNTLTVEQFRLLLSELGWTVADWSRETGLESPEMGLTAAQSGSESGKAEANLLDVDHAVVPFTKRVPLLSATGGRTFYFDIPDGLWRPNTVAAIIQGDSMSPTLDPGDIALADTSLLDLRDGEMYIFEIPGDGYTIKRIYRSNGGWELHPDNRKYRPMLLPEDWRVVGEVYDAWGPKGVRWRNFRLS